MRANRKMCLGPNLALHKRTHLSCLDIHQVVGDGIVWYRTKSGQTSRIRQRRDAGQLAAFRGTNAPPEPSSCGTNATLHGWRIYAGRGLHRFDRRVDGQGEGPPARPVHGVPQARPCFHTTDDSRKMSFHVMCNGGLITFEDPADWTLGRRR